MELVFVRHGQPEWARDRIAFRNPPLTDLGQAQAKATASHLAASEKVTTELVVSPLVRAQQTAAPIAAELGIEPTTLDWLAEIGSPESWEGAPIEEVERVFAAGRNRSIDELWDGLPGGESVRDFHERIVQGTDGFLAARGADRVTPEPPQWRFTAPDRRIVIVAHAGTNATILGHLLGIPPVPWEWERFVTMHASLSEVEPVQIGGAAVYSLVRLSDVCHLPADHRTR